MKAKSTKDQIVKKNHANLWDKRGGSPFEEATQKPCLTDQPQARGKTDPTECWQEVSCGLRAVSCVLWQSPDVTEVCPHLRELSTPPEVKVVQALRETGARNHSQADWTSSASACSGGICHDRKLSLYLGSLETRRRG